MSARSHGNTFPARFPNVFVDYPLGQMHVGDKLWTNWNKAVMRLWQAQLNFAMWCASSANYTEHPVIRLVYRFHIYYHMRRILKNYRCLCHMRPVLMQLIILILSQNFKKFVRIMESLTIL